MVMQNLYVIQGRPSWSSKFLIAAINNSGKFDMELQFEETKDKDGKPYSCLAWTNQNDYDLLKAKRFIIEFPDGICVIKHWRINNYIRKDRYHETTYTDEKDMLAVKKNGAYSLKSSDSEIGIPECNRCVTESRVDKSRVEENRTEPVAMFNAEKAWDDTFNIYPKKSEAVMAKQAWLDKLAQVLDENRKEVALLIAGATRMYLADYREKHRDDENYQYIPKYAKWLVNDCDYWIREYEKRSEGDGS